MKILCLHGFRHNSTSLKRSMSGLIKKLSRNDIEFDFFQSPIKYIPTKEEIDSSIDCNDLYQWWSATRENVLNNEIYDTVEESLKNLLEKWNSDKYDGILGFSQGSVLVQLFIYKIQKKIFDTYEPKFMILAGPFPPSDKNYVDYFRIKKTIKTIIMIGSKDTLIPMDISLSLKDHFNDVIILVHSGGHYVSSSTEVIYPLLDILKKIN